MGKYGLQSYPLFLFKVVLLLLVCCYSNVKGNECRRLSITHLLNEKALINHTIRTIQPIADARACGIQCYLEPLCFAYNFCNKNGNSSCELTNSDHIRHEKDLVDKAGCTYYGSESECSRSPCPYNATCLGDFPTHSKRPFKCVCPSGFSGENCQDINECSAGTHDCHVNATCYNTIGGFICTCKTGYHGNGKQCEETDECESQIHDCHVNATCTNTIGGFNCSCKEGLLGNGTHCCFVLGWQVIFDFESGGKTGWTLTGTVFNNQPTYGDNSANRGKPSNLRGDWWIGGYENRPSPSDPAGRTQGDGPKGTMTSPPFVIHGPKLRFLIGGGRHIQKERAELLIGGNVVAKETGPCSETMVTRYWDVTGYHGQTAQLRLVDENTGGWGHINFDHLEGQICT